MHLHLVVPDLLWPDPQQPSAGASCALPALLNLLAKGRVRDGTARSADDWLLQAFGVPEGGIAAYARHADAGGDALQDGWMRADPCHLRVNRDRLMLIDASCFELSGAEAQALSARLNAHFAADGLRFDVLQGSRWYLRGDSLPPIETTPLAEARGRDIDPLMPRGPDAMFWRRMLNEAQMLLHDHPVNEAREARGELPINSLWLWGEGRAPAPPVKPFQRVRTRDPLAAGLAQSSGAMLHPLPDDAARWLGQAQPEGVELVLLDSLTAPATYGDLHAWESRLTALETEWFAPALAALSAGRLGMLSLHVMGPGGGFEAETARNDLRHFWKRRRPLRHYSASP
jgi:hypothetical protein